MSPKSKKEAKPEKGGKKVKKVEKTQEEIEMELELKRLEVEAEARLEKENQRLLKWKPYELYVDELIGVKMIEAVIRSFVVFLIETNYAQNPNLFPLFEILLELHEPNVVYVRSTDLDDPDGFLLFVQSLLDNINGMARYMQRILKEDAPLNYEQDVLQDSEGREMYAEVLNRVTIAIDEANEYIGNFDDYAYLWLDDRQEFLRQFLLYSRELTGEELDAVRDNTPLAPKECPPQISQFKEQIDLYEELYKKVELIETVKIIHGWLRVDVRPLRQAILNTVCKWGNLFKQHLFNHVINSITELENFIEEAIHGMQTPLSEDDYPTLLKIMGYLVKVRDRQLATDVMFDPLKDIIELLKEYGMEFDEEIHVRLQELPDKWIYCKKVICLCCGNVF